MRRPNNYHKKLIIAALVIFPLTAAAQWWNPFGWLANAQEPEPRVGAPVSTFHRNLLPITDSTYELGTSSRKWKNVYTDEVCLAGDCKTTWPSGSGGGAAFPFTPTINFGVPVSATNTPIWAQAGIQASSTSVFATTTASNLNNVVVVEGKQYPRTSTGITAAINAAGGASTTVQLTEGVYSMTSQINLAGKTGITISCNSRGVIFRIPEASLPNFSFGYIFSGDGTSQDIVIENCTFDGNYSNYSSPSANQGGGIAPGKRWTIRNNEFKDFNYFGLFLGGGSSEVKILNNYFSGPGRGNDHIGGGAAHNIEIVGNTWAANIVGNAFDNVNGANYNIHDNYVLAAKNFYLEGMNHSKVHHNFFLNGGSIAVLSDAGYLPLHVNNARYIEITDNTIQGGGISYQGYASSTDPLTTIGGNLLIHGNTISTSTQGAILVHFSDASTTHQGSSIVITDNKIYNANTSGNTSQNTGLGINNPSGINVMQGRGVVITGNTIVDDRSTPLQNYCIQIGQGSNPSAASEPNDVTVANNHCSGYVIGDINVVSPTFTTRYNALQASATSTLTAPFTVGGTRNASIANSLIGIEATGVPGLGMHFSGVGDNSAHRFLIQDDSSGAQGTFYIRDNSTQANWASMIIDSDRTGQGLFVDMNGSGKAIFVDHDDTGTNPSIDIDRDGNNAAAITGLKVNVANAGAGAAYAAIFEAGSVGIGTTTPGSILSIQSIGNFRAGTSTLYSGLNLPNLNATGTVQATNFTASSLSACDSIDTDTAGNFKCGTDSGSSFAYPFPSNSTSTNLTFSGGITVTCTDCITDANVADLAVGGDTSGTLSAIAVTDDSHAHTGTTISGLDISDDTNLTAGDGLTLTGDDIDCDVASASIPGCLSAADWTTFNNKGGVGTSTNPLMATYFVATSTTATSTFSGPIVFGSQPGGNQFVQIEPPSGIKGLDITLSGTRGNSAQGITLTESSASAGTNAFISITDNNTSNQWATMFIDSDRTGNGIYLDMNGSGKGLFIDHDDTGGNPSIDIDRDGNSSSQLEGLWVNAVNAGAGGAVAAIFEAGSVGIGTTTPGSLLSVQSVGNFAGGTSTMYSNFLAGNITATNTLSTLGTFKIGTESYSSFLGNGLDNIAGILTTNCTEITGSADLCDGDDASGAAASATSTYTYSICASGCDYSDINVAVDTVAASSTLLIKNGNYDLGGTGITIPAGKSLSIYGESRDGVHVNYTGAGRAFDIGDDTADTRYMDIKNISVHVGPDALRGFSFNRVKTSNFENLNCEGAEGGDCFRIDGTGGYAGENNFYSIQCRKSEDCLTFTTVSNDNHFYGVNMRANGNAIDINSGNGNTINGGLVSGTIGINIRGDENYVDGIYCEANGTCVNMEANSSDNHVTVIDVETNTTLVTDVGTENQFFSSGDNAVNYMNLNTFGLGATTSPSSLLSLQGVANFRAGTSTMYSGLVIPNIRATGTIQAAGATVTGDLLVDGTTLRVNSATDKVGIGTLSPTEALEVNGNMALLGASPATLYLNYRAGNDSIMIRGITNGGLNLNSYPANTNPIWFSFNTAEAGRFHYVGVGDYRFGVNDTSPDFRVETVGSGGSGYFGITNSSDGDIFQVNGSGNVGIATTSPGTKLSVVGAVVFDSLPTGTGANSLCLGDNDKVTSNTGDACTTSLRSAKKDIKTLDVDALKIVEALESVSYIYKDDPTNREHYGFIADDVELIDKHLASYSNQDGKLTGIEDRGFISVIVQALKELKDMVFQHEDRLDQLEKENDELKARLDALEANHQPQ